MCVCVFCVFNLTGYSAVSYLQFTSVKVVEGACLCVRNCWPHTSRRVVVIKRSSPPGGKRAVENMKVGVLPSELSGKSCTC